ncbi:hypothetical protein BGX28_005741 [Mortierella sp. GBA30]|nr:hypothetical protein BGX28_005741 [Mortierella sp. GBA30]
MSGVWRKRRIQTTIRETTNTGYRFPEASIQCADNERVTGGGGECQQPNGFIWVISSKPDGNGWYVGCDGGLKTEWGTAHVWATIKVYPVTSAFPYFEERISDTRRFIHNNTKFDYKLFKLYKIKYSYAANIKNLDDGGWRGYY